MDRSGWESGWVKTQREGGAAGRLPDSKGIAGTEGGVCECRPIYEMLQIHRGSSDEAKLFDLEMSSLIYGGKK